MSWTECIYSEYRRGFRSYCYESEFMMKERVEMRRKNLAFKVAALAMSGTLALSPMAVRAEEMSGSGVETEGISGEDSREAATEEVNERITGTGDAGISSEEEAMAEEADSASEDAAVENAVTRVIENKIDHVVTDKEMQGTDIYHDISGIKEWWEDLGESTWLPGEHVSSKVKIGAEDAKKDDTVKPEYSEAFFDSDKSNNKTDAKEYAEQVEAAKNKDLLVYGDLSIVKENSEENPDSTGEKPHDAERGSYALKANYDVSAIQRAVETFHKFMNYGVFEITEEKAEKSDASWLSGGFQSDFVMGPDLKGSFYIPKNSEDAKKNYSLSSIDGNSLLYRINYEKSVFTKDKVSLVMDMDVSKTAYEKNPGFSNFKEMIRNSAKKMQLWVKGIMLEEASGNKKETEGESGKTTVTQGSLLNTMVGYLHAGATHEEQSEDYYSDMHGGRGEKMSFSTSSLFRWGAVQSEAGRDSIVGKESDKLALTVQFTNVEKNNLPNENSDPVRPNNGGNGGGGNGSAYRTPIIPAGSPVASTVSNTNDNPGEVLGVNRSDSHTEDTSALEEKKGEVLGESRSSEATLSARAKVSTGDKNFTALWASLFGLSVAAFAGFVLLQRKKEVK